MTGYGRREGGCLSGREGRTAAVAGCSDTELVCCIYGDGGEGGREVRAEERVVEGFEVEVRDQVLGAAQGRRVWICLAVSVDYSMPGV